MNKQIENLINKIRGDEPFLSFELTPPLSADTGEFIAKIKSALSQSVRQNPKHQAKSSVHSHLPKTLGEVIDAFVCTDSPLARFKPSSILSSIKLQNTLGKPLICTLSMRDRNSIALCGEILAANEFDLRAFLTLTGDPIKLGDCANSKGVFEENSLKLARIIADLNSGIAINGKPLIARPREIFAFSTINSYANNPASLKTKLKRKLLHSPICAFFTQPIFERESAEFLLEALDEVKREILEGKGEANLSDSGQHIAPNDFAPNKDFSQHFAPKPQSDSSKDCTRESIQNAQIIFGFFPVLSYRVAVFLRDKLPGVYIPQMWLDKLQAASTKGKDYEREVGLELSRSVWRDLHDLSRASPKIHFMSSNHIELLGEFV